MSSLFDLSGRTALVTGSARGLGFSYAEGLAKAGAAVVLNDLREDVLNESVKKLQDQGFQARGVVFDVSDE